LQTLIETNRLTKQFGDFTPLSCCSLQVQQGEVFGLLGPNGAGKSTLIRLLLGFLSPSSGSATIAGFDCWRQRDQVHQRLSYIPGDARLFRMMKGRQILNLFAEFRTSGRQELHRRIEKGMQLAKILELDLTRWVGLMSTGMRQKLALVVCFMAETPVLILDEPTANLDPTVRAAVLDLIADAKGAKQTVIFSSHVLSEIEESCDRVAILKAGQLVHQAPMSEIKLQHRIRARLLGQFPTIPAELAGQLNIQVVDQHLQIDTAEGLTEVLKWLSDASLIGIHVQPIGLRSVYDRFHRSFDEERIGGSASGSTK
jgi:ABC-2 type transport system ATP-binding protein